MNRSLSLLFSICLAPLTIIGCTLSSQDIMYGPGGEIVKTKSPRKKMKITVKDDEVKIKGARGIGGQPRVRMPAVPVETERDVGIHDVMVPAPPNEPVVPVVPQPGVPVHRKETTSEQQTIVH